MTFFNSQQISPTTKLSHLNVDNLFKIIEYLSIQDVISIKNTNKYLSTVAEEFLSHEFSKKLIIFDVTNSLFNPEEHSRVDHGFSINFLDYFQTMNTELVIMEDEHSIQFKNANRLIKYILNRGIKIRKLMIVDYEYNQIGDDVKDIFKLIEKQCFDTLIELHVSNLKIFFETIETTFKNVDTLSWSIFSKSVRDMDEYKLREHFPSLRSLELTNAPTSKTTLNIENLEHLCISSADDQATIDFLKANQQIKSLDLRLLHPNVFQFVADEMPNVEKLKIQFTDLYGNSSVYFNHLKSITIDSGSPGIIQFSDKLEEFVTVNFPTVENMQFLTNNSNVKTIKIEKILTAPEIQKLIFADFGANHLSLGIHESIKPNNITLLIESCANLNKFSFKMGETNDQIKTYVEWDKEQTIVNHFYDWTLTKDEMIYSLTKNNI